MKNRQIFFFPPIRTWLGGCFNTYTHTGLWSLNGWVLPRVEFHTMISGEKFLYIPIPVVVVVWIRIRSFPKLFAGSGSRIWSLDPNQKYLQLTELHLKRILRRLENVHLPDLWCKSSFFIQQKSKLKMLYNAGVL